MLKIITDAILNFFVILYKGFIALLTPVTNLVALINSGIKSFSNFAVPILEYTLWFFNVPVLLIATGLLAASFLFLYGEYITKLIIKYVTRLF